MPPRKSGVVRIGRPKVFRGRPIRPRIYSPRIVVGRPYGYGYGRGWPIFIGGGGGIAIAIVIIIIIVIIAIAIASSSSSPSVNAYRVESSRNNDDNFSTIGIHV